MFTHHAEGIAPMFVDYSKKLQPSSVKAYFTTRLGGVSQGRYKSLNLGRTVPDARDNVEKNYALLKAKLPPKARFIYCSQVHGISIYIDNEAADGHVGEYDGLISNQSDVILQTLHADCFPVYAVDTKTGWYGVVHSGWRGTYCGISRELINTLVYTVGTCIADLKFVIGPGIGVSFYEVSRQLYKRFENKFGSTCVKTKKDTYYLDLSKCIYRTLVSQGVLAHQIYVEPRDTYGYERLFFSYRRQGSKSGRMSALMFKEF